MSKTSFRSRNLDVDRVLQIYFSNEVPELNDSTAVYRTVTQAPTGMEKEEEHEFHLTEAMEAQSLFGHVRRQAIPTPEITQIFKYTQNLKRTFDPPKNLIKFNTFDIKEEKQLYDMDTDDENWLSSNSAGFDRPISRDRYEELMVHLEWLHTYQPNDFSLGYLSQTLNETELNTRMILDRWKYKRQGLANDYSLIPKIRTEQSDSSQLHDPYVAFRKRNEKMQTRKNRKNDEIFYDKVMKSRITVNRSQSLISASQKRDRIKKANQNSIRKIFTQRLKAPDPDGIVFRNYLRLVRESNQAEFMKLCNPLVGIGVLEHENLMIWDSPWRSKHFSHGFPRKIRMASLVGKMKKISISTVNPIEIVSSSVDNIIPTQNIMESGLLTAFSNGLATRNTFAFRKHIGRLNRLSYFSVSLEQILPIKVGKIKVPQSEHKQLLDSPINPTATNMSTNFQPYKDYTDNVSPTYSTFNSDVNYPNNHQTTEKFFKIHNGITLPDVISNVNPLDDFLK